MHVETETAPQEGAAGIPSGGLNRFFSVNFVPNGPLGRRTLLPAWHTRPALRPANSPKGSGPSSTRMGTLAGSTLGFLAPLAGALALFNAHLNRRRDDRERRHSATAVATALYAELELTKNIMLDNAESLSKTAGADGFFVPPPTIKVIPSPLNRFELFRPEALRRLRRLYRDRANHQGAAHIGRNAAEQSEQRSALAAGQICRNGATNARGQGGVHRQGSHRSQTVLEALSAGLKAVALA